MKQCPYCQSEMEKGYIYNGREDLCWTPLDQSRSWIVNHPKKHQVSLGKLHLFTGCRVLVYRCSSCNIQLIDEVENKKAQDANEF